VQLDLYTQIILSVLSVYQSANKSIYTTRFKIQKYYVPSTLWLCVCCMDLSTNSDYLPRVRKFCAFYNRSGVFTARYKLQVPTHSGLCSSVKCSRMWIGNLITRDRRKARSPQMTMTGAPLVDGKGHTAYTLKHEIREGKYFTHRKPKAQFCSQHRTCCRAWHVRNKNLQLFEK
jgi:hypothetical protein